MKAQRIPAGSVGEYWFQEGVFIEELMNTPADPAASLARARLPAGHQTRLHAVMGTVERYIIVGGQGVAQIGGREFAVGPGDQVLIPAGMPQRIRADDAGELVFLCLCTPRFEPANYRDLETDAPA